MMRIESIILLLASKQLLMMMQSRLQLMSFTTYFFFLQKHDVDGYVEFDAGDALATWNQK